MFNLSGAELEKNVIKQQQWMVKAWYMMVSLPVCYLFSTWQGHFLRPHTLLKGFSWIGCLHAAANVQFLFYVVKGQCGTHVYVPAKRWRKPRPMKWELLVSSPVTYHQVNLEEFSTFYAALPISTLYQWIRRCNKMEYEDVLKVVEVKCRGCEVHSQSRYMWQKDSSRVD